MGLGGLVLGLNDHQHTYFSTRRNEFHSTGGITDEDDENALHQSREQVGQDVIVVVVDVVVVVVDVVVVVIAGVFGNRYNAGIWRAC